MASTTSDSLPSSPSLPTTAADQEFSSSHHHHHQSLFLPSSSSSPASLYLDSSFHGLLPTSSSTAMSSPSPPPPAAAPPLPPAPAPAKPAKKRPRASRRPPTTVLTTDTSNFRAMVQEFTGIPAPPFAAAGAARSRLDSLLFPSRSSSSATAALPQYLLRPFAHKLPVPAYPPPSTSSPATANAAAPAGASTAGVAPGNGYQHHLTTAAPSALLGMQDHGGGGSYLSFQSALAGQLDGGGGEAGKYPLLVPRPLPDPTDFLGLAHGVVTSEAHLHQRNGDHGHGGDELSGLVGGCKATYSSAPPLLGRNGRGSPAGASTAAATTAPMAPATVAMRTQGVESWVCSTSE